MFRLEDWKLGYVTNPISIRHITNMCINVMQRNDIYLLRRDHSFWTGLEKFMKFIKDELQNLVSAIFRSNHVHALSFFFNVSIILFV